MYTVSNLPFGYFEEMIDGVWVKSFPQRVMAAMKANFGKNAAAYFDELVLCGLQNRPVGFVTRPLFRFVSVKG